MASANTQSLSSLSFGLRSLLAAAIVLVAVALACIADRARLQTDRARLQTHLDAAKSVIRDSKLQLLSELKR